MELIVKKCDSCGAVVKAIKDCECPGCGFTCCDKPMRELKPNSVDAAVEKHVPQYEVKGDKIVATVNHVMEDEHYIEWISLVTEDTEDCRYFKPGKVATAEFDYVPGSKLYAYCNKHGLWENDVK